MDDHVGKPISPRELLTKIVMWGEAREDAREGLATDGAQA